MHILVNTKKCVNDLYVGRRDLHVVRVNRNQIITAAVDIQYPAGRFSF